MAIHPLAGKPATDDILIDVAEIEKAYYERLNKEFEKYDTVLYELVAPEGINPPEERRAEARHPPRHAPTGHEILPAAGTSA